MKRRKSVMSRSIKLGHCVCNPKQACPCDDFKNYNVCACAGERRPIKTGTIGLTKYVKRAGCASKIGQADLLRILSTLPPVTDPNVLLGAAAGDDAGIYRLNDQFNLVQTVDVFSPVVDDAYLFGQIAAANSVSDVYAMGGRPLTALSIVGFPIDELDGRLMEEMIRGGMEKLQEAQCSLIGGHSINDDEIKFGFAVTGLIDARRVVERSNARPGDVLILTKPLGTGMISFAAQIGRISEECLNEAGAHMATLNRDAAELMVKYDANACTDITGFGLAGHLVEMVRGSRVVAEIDMSALPVFAAVAYCIENEILSGAIERNQEYAMAWVEVADGSGEKNLPILYDPQTSGGLLVSLPEKNAQSFVEEMHDRGHLATSVIGRMMQTAKTASDGKVMITNSQLQNYIGRKEDSTMARKEERISALQTTESDAAPVQDACCCSTAGAPAPAATPAAPVEESSAIASDAFREFMKLANAEGLIDKRAKKLMAIALSVAQRCKPCLIIHIKSALAMGISKAEIEEAATLAISFSGCPAMMFYKDVCAKLNL